MASTAATPTDDEGPFACEACGETFDSAEALDRHLREVGLVA